MDKTMNTPAKQKEIDMTKDELKPAQQALAHELMNARFSEAADYMMGDYMKAVMAEKLPRPTAPNELAELRGIMDVAKALELMAYTSAAQGSDLSKFLAVQAGRLLVEIDKMRGKGA